MQIAIDLPPADSDIGPDSGQGLDASTDADPASIADAASLDIDASLSVADSGNVNKPQDLDASAEGCVRPGDDCDGGVSPESTLLAHWSFDGHALDSSGNGFHGWTLKGAKFSPGNGAHNQALQLDVVGATVLVSRFAQSFRGIVAQGNPDEPRARATVYMRYRRSDERVGTLLSLGRQDLDSAENSLVINTAKVGSAASALRLYTERGMSVGNSVSWDTHAELGAWEELAIVLDGRSYKTYSNGVLAGGGSYVPPETATQKFHIGSYEDVAGSTFFGAIDEVQIFGSAMSAEQVQQLPVRAAEGLRNTPCGSVQRCAPGLACVEGLCLPSCDDALTCAAAATCVDGGCVQLPAPIAWFTFDGHTEDVTDNGWDAVPVFAPQYVPGSVDQALQFDGQQRLESRVLGLQMSDDRSLYLRFRTGGPTGSPKENAILLWFGGLDADVGGTGFTLLESGYAYDDTELGRYASPFGAARAWTDVVVNVLGTEIQTWVNGELRNTSSAYTHTEFLDLFIGGAPERLSGGFVGDIDEFRFYSRGLRAAEVRALFAGRE